MHQSPAPPTSTTLSTILTKAETYRDTGSCALEFQLATTIDQLQRLLVVEQQGTDDKNLMLNLLSSSLALRNTELRNRIIDYLADQASMQSDLCEFANKAITNSTYCHIVNTRRRVLTNTRLVGMLTPENMQKALKYDPEERTINHLLQDRPNRVTQLAGNMHSLMMGATNRYLINQLMLIPELVQALTLEDLETIFSSIGASQALEFSMYYCRLKLPAIVSSPPDETLQKLRNLFTFLVPPKRISPRPDHAKNRINIAIKSLLQTSLELEEPAQTRMIHHLAEDEVISPHLYKFINNSINEHFPLSIHYLIMNHPILISGLHPNTLLTIVYKCPSLTTVNQLLSEQPNRVTQLAGNIGYWMRHLEPNTRVYLIKRLMEIPDLVSKLTIEDMCAILKTNPSSNVVDWLFQGREGLTEQLPGQLYKLLAKPTTESPELKAHLVQTLMNIPKLLELLGVWDICAIMQYHQDGDVINWLLQPRNNLISLLSDNLRQLISVNPSASMVAQLIGIPNLVAALTAEDMYAVLTVRYLPADVIPSLLAVHPNLHIQLLQLLSPPNVPRWYNRDDTEHVITQLKAIPQLVDAFTPVPPLAPPIASKDPVSPQDLLATFIAPVDTDSIPRIDWLLDHHLDHLLQNSMVGMLIAACETYRAKYHVATRVVQLIEAAKADATETTVNHPIDLSQEDKYAVVSIRFDLRTIYQLFNQFSQREIVCPTEVDSLPIYCTDDTMEMYRINGLICKAMAYYHLQQLPFRANPFNFSQALRYLVAAHDYFVRHHFSHPLQAPNLKTQTTAMHAILMDPSVENIQQHLSNTAFADPDLQHMLNFPKLLTQLTQHPIHFATAHYALALYYLNRLPITPKQPNLDRAKLHLMAIGDSRQSSTQLDVMIGQRNASKKIELYHKAQIELGEIQSLRLRECSATSLDLIGRLIGLKHFLNAGLSPSDPRVSGLLTMIKHIINPSVDKPPYIQSSNNVRDLSSTLAWFRLIIPFVNEHGIIKCDHIEPKQQGCLSNTARRALVLLETYQQKHEKSIAALTLQSFFRMKKHERSLKRSALTLQCFWRTKHSPPHNPLSSADQGLLTMHSA